MYVPNWQNLCKVDGISETDFNLIWNVCNINFEQL